MNAGNLQMLKELLSIQYIDRFLSRVFFCFLVGLYVLLLVSGCKESSREGEE